MWNLSLGKMRSLKKLEEALPTQKKGVIQKVSRLYKAKTRVGCDGFQPESSPGRDKTNEMRNRGVLGKGGAEWEMAATSLYNDVCSS